jgi:transcriptional regulator with XRE-family HTH domain
MPPEAPTPFQERFEGILRTAKEAGMSQQDLAQRIGCSKNMIKLWRTGQHKPQRHHAEAISELLGISFEELFKPPAPVRAREADSVDPHDLLSRFAELELDVVLEKVQEAAPHLQQLQSSIPSLLDLLAEAKRVVGEEDR